MTTVTAHTHSDSPVRLSPLPHCPLPVQGRAVERSAVCDTLAQQPVHSYPPLTIKGGLAFQAIPGLFQVLQPLHRSLLIEGSLVNHEHPLWSHCLSSRPNTC